MLKRLFWLGAGVAAGAYAVRRLQRTAESLSPSGLAGSLSDAIRDGADALRTFSEDVRASMATREDELRDALGITGDGVTDAPADVSAANGTRPPGAAPAR